ncbi:MAG: response regulator [Chitinivibrionales bacterium]|nr:response regulator [Chitinivibrionales bacterium]
MNFSSKKISNTILVVDDEEDVLDFLAIFLHSLGWDIAPSSSVSHAIELLEEQPFFLILTDIAMPEMDGYEFLAALRNKQVNSEVALMTGFGYNPKHTLIKIKRISKCAIFFKPFDKYKLAEGIQHSWLEYHRAFYQTARKAELI